MDLYGIMTNSEVMSVDHQSSHRRCRSTWGRWWHERGPHRQSIGQEPEPVSSSPPSESSLELSPSRSTPQNATLFYDVQNTNLTLYDATSTPDLPFLFYPQATDGL